MNVLAWPAFKTRYMNPYPWLLYTHLQGLGIAVEEFSTQRLLRSHYDIIHLHWPVETIVRHPSWWVALGRVVAFLSLLQWAKWRGGRLVWTIHDERPHVLLHQRLAGWCEALLVRQVDAYINLCDRSQDAVEKTLPALVGKPSFVIPHGHYRGVYPRDLSPQSARERLGIPQALPVLLYLGYVSPYKNIPHLIQTFRQLPEKSAHLVIAGRPDNATLEQEIVAAAGDDDHIHLHLKFIADKDLQGFFKAADLVVLPFQTILNSGSTLLALSFDRPVLAPHLGAIPEWQAQFGTDWVQTYDGALTPERLQGAIAQIQPMAGDRTAPLDRLDWSEIAQQTLQVYRKLMR